MKKERFKKDLKFIILYREFSNNYTSMHIPIHPSRPITKVSFVDGKNVVRVKSLCGRIFRLENCFNAKLFDKKIVKKLICKKCLKIFEKGGEKW